MDPQGLVVEGPGACSWMGGGCVGSWLAIALLGKGSRAPVLPSSGWIRVSLDICCTCVPRKLHINRLCIKGTSLQCKKNGYVPMAVREGGSKAVNREGAGGGVLCNVLAAVAPPPRLPFQWCLLQQGSKHRELSVAAGCRSGRPDSCCYMHPGKAAGWGATLGSS